MTDHNQPLKNSQGDSQATPTAEFSQNSESVEAVTLPVEGKNEIIHTPPQEVQENIVAVARAMEDITMGIEDES